MKTFLEYFDFNKISLPTAVDLEVGMDLSEKHSNIFEKIIREIYSDDHKDITFNCNYNGILKNVIIESNNMISEFSIKNDDVIYKLINNNTNDNMCVVEKLNECTFNNIVKKINKWKENQIAMKWMI